MMKPKVSIIILNYNGSRFIEGCLSSVLKTDYPNFEVILVDNASKDESLKIAGRLFGKDHVLKSSEIMRIWASPKEIMLVLGTLGVTF